MKPLLRALFGPLHRCVAALRSRIPLVSFSCRGRSCLENLGGSLHACRAYIGGEGNRVILRRGSRLQHCDIRIYGRNNVIDIGEGCILNHVTLWIEDDNNEIRIGERSHFHGTCQLAAIEGTSIRIGKECMFSSEICVRTGDSHSILDVSGKRINPSAAVSIGERVWMGHRAMVMKGVSVADDCVIGAGSIVAKNIDEAHCIAAGVPARIVKRGVTWDSRRLP